MPTKTLIFAEIFTENGQKATVPGYVYDMNYKLQVCLNYRFLQVKNKQWKYLLLHEKNVDNIPVVTTGILIFDPQWT